MAEQQYRLAARFAREIDLQMIAEIGGTMDTDLSAERGELLRDGLGQTIHCGLFVAGRFDFDQLADRRDDLLASFLEIGEAALGFRACGSGWFPGVRHVSYPNEKRGLCDDRERLLRNKHHRESDFE